MESLVSKEKLDELVETSITDGIEKLVVGAVIWIDGGVLLLKRVEDDFLGGLTELPSGAVDPGEDLLEALGREVKEETNLEVSNVREYLGAFDYVSGSGKSARQYTFFVETKPGVVALDPDEHESYQITSPAEPAFSQANISENVRSILSSL